MLGTEVLVFFRCLAAKVLMHYDETKKRAHNSYIVENLKLSHSGPSYSQASGINPPIKALRQSHHRI